MFLRSTGRSGVQLVNFAIFYAILYVVFLRPVQRAIVKRREYIDGLTHDYDRAQAQAIGLSRARPSKFAADARRESDHSWRRLATMAATRRRSIASDYAMRVQSIVEDAHRKVAQ